jgi:CheY-like chemotaxis protein
MGKTAGHTWQGTLTLECRGEQLDKTVTLAFAVEDTGEGIATSKLATLFEPFERGDTSTPGHGLGLSICRELLRQMGSDVFVTSTLGRGSRFFFSLSVPVIKHSSSSSAAPQEWAPLPLTHNSPSILLVDDDAIQLDLLAELCKEAGFAVKAVSGGRDAQAQIQAHAWSIILTDQMMPDVDGWGVLWEARTLQPGVPVVMLSAAEPQQQPNMPPDMRFDVTLLKPTFSEDILATLWQLLIKVSVGETALNWGELARLASEGDVSAIEDWIASARSNFNHCDQAMVWLEGLLNRLELALLERVATALASP